MALYTSYTDDQAFDFNLTITKSKRFIVKPVTDIIFSKNIFLFLVTIHSIIHNNTSSVCMCIYNHYDFVKTQRTL